MAERNSWPWLVQILSGERDQLICTGTIFSGEWILTSQKCCENPSTMEIVTEFTPYNIRINNYYKYDSICLISVGGLQIDSFLTEEVCLEDSGQEISYEECYTAGWQTYQSTLMSYRIE